MIWMWTSYHPQRDVILVNSSIHRGEIIEANDLSITSISADQSISTLSTDHIDKLIGSYSRSDLAAGSLIPDKFLDEPSLPEGRAQMGLHLEAGRIPSQRLLPGTPIELIALNDSGSPQVFKAIALNSQDDHQSRLLDIEVSSNEAAAIAELAAENRLVVIRKGGV